MFCFKSADKKQIFFFGENSHLTKICFCLKMVAETSFVTLGNNAN